MYFFYILQFHAKVIEAKYAQTFWLVNNNDKTVSLMLRSLGNGLAVFLAAKRDSRPNAEAGVIVDTEPTPSQDAAKFYLNREPNRAVSLLSVSNDKFLAADFNKAMNGKIVINAAVAKEWETFIIEPAIAKRFVPSFIYLSKNV